MITMNHQLELRLHTCQISGHMCQISQHMCQISGHMYQISRHMCKISQHMCQISGHMCQISGHMCKIFGHMCQISGHMCQILGHTCQISGHTYQMSGHALVWRLIAQHSNRTTYIDLCTPHTEIVDHIGMTIVSSIVQGIPPVEQHLINIKARLQLMGNKIPTSTIHYKQTDKQYLNHLKGK